MNSKGFGFMNILLFLASLFLVGLYIAVGEPLLVGLLSTSTVAAPGSDAYIIILGAPILIILAGIYFLTKEPSNLQFGA